MAAIASGSNFSTLAMDGVALNVVSVVNTTSNPEYPAMPFTFGTKTVGLDDSEWVFCSSAANYAIGTVVSMDTSWKATALTSTSATSAIGMQVGVLSQVATALASPTTTNYEGVWVQVAGLCPAILVVASASANAQMYSSATSGELTTASTGNTAINGIILTTASGTSAGNAPGLLNFPEISLTT